MKRFLLTVFIIFIIFTACGEKSNKQTITFPVLDKEETVFEIEPFEVSLEFPADWTLKRRDDYNDKLALFGVWSIMDIFNANGELVGAIGYNVYEPYEGAEDLPAAIYNQIALGNDYQFDVRESYKVVKETDSGVTATADVLYSASINGGEEKINKGIVSYNKNLLVYIAIEFASGLVTEEEINEIAKSIEF